MRYYRGGAYELHESKKLKRRGGGERWEPIVFDRDGNETVDEGERLTASRLRILAVKNLGYTHTEAGFRRAGAIIDEYIDYADMISEAREDKMNDDIFD